MLKTRTVIIDDIEVNLYQIMILKNAKRNSMTLFNSGGHTIDCNMFDLQLKGLVYTNHNKYYRLTDKGFKWLNKYNDWSEQNVSSKQAKKSK